MVPMFIKLFCCCYKLRENHVWNIGSGQTIITGSRMNYDKNINKIGDFSLHPVFLFSLYFKSYRSV